MEDLYFKEDGGTLTVCLFGDIDHHVAKGMRERIDLTLACKKPELLIMNFSGVSFMDSSGIGLILGRSRMCEQLGARLRITGVSDSTRKLMQLSGIEKIKNISVSQ